MTDLDLDTHIQNLEIELSEAYILQDKTRAAYLEKVIAELYASQEN